MNALRSVTWRALLITQSLAVLFAFAPWLEAWGEPGRPSLGYGLFAQSVAALLVMLAAFHADDSVRRGASALRAFATQLLAACLATSLIVLAVDRRNHGEPLLQLASLLNTFFNTGAYWGTPMLVYLNRRSAARLLAMVQDGELRRVQAERRLVESDLAAAQAEINPAAVMQQLGHLRALYAAGSAEADGELSKLIADLRDTVARCNR